MNDFLLLAKDDDHKNQNKFWGFDILIPNMEQLFKDRSHSFKKRKRKTSRSGLKKNRRNQMKLILLYIFLKNLEPSKFFWSFCYVSLEQEWSRRVFRVPFKSPDWSFFEKNRPRPAGSKTRKIIAEKITISRDMFINFLANQLQIWRSHCRLKMMLKVRLKHFNNLLSLFK